jgi:hypothetical protein
MSVALTAPPLDLLILWQLQMHRADQARCGLSWSRVFSMVDPSDVVVKESSSLTASWKMVGDSIFVKHMTLPPTEWVLDEAGSALRGRLHTETDNISTDAEGRPVKYRGDWPALLSRVDCGSVAQPSTTR